MELLLQKIRRLGWYVAVHNDYRQDEKFHTFWLFTKMGRAVKGEGRTDALALEQVLHCIMTMKCKGVID